MLQGDKKNDHKKLSLVLKISSTVGRLSVPLSVTVLVQKMDPFSVKYDKNHAKMLLLFPKK